MDSGPDFVRLAVGSKGGVVVSDGTDPSYLSVGANGQVLVADSGVSKGVAWVDPQTNRNVVINGAMQVAQHGTSTASITTSSYYTADRFNISITSIGTWTESIENDAPTGSGFRKSLKILCTTADAAPAAGDALLRRQLIEGQNMQQFLKGTASAKQFSLSFWVKSNVTGTYIAELRDNDNIRQVSASYTISASDTWEKKTITFPADTTGAFDNDNGRSLDLHWWLGAGSNFTSGTLNTTWASITNANRVVGQTNLAAATDNYWQITGVQLEAGSVATPFEFEDISTTLAKCQRYYYRTTPTAAGQNLGVGFADLTTSALLAITLPTTMRTAPTALQTNGTAADYTVRQQNGSSTACSVVPVFGSATTNVVVSAFTVAAGLTAGNGVMGRAAGSGAYLGWSAEL
jgi:hypothetical protein